MEHLRIDGVHKKNGKLLTENLPDCKGQSVYGERLSLLKDKEYRLWNPFRSKLAALILKSFNKIEISYNSKILYLGAATGTTVSHISDIVRDGEVYAVENSAFAMKKLLESCMNRLNVIPIMEDANHPTRYYSLVPKVDFLYQDISQRNQAEIFIKNIKKYLKDDSQAIIMVKARSIDVSIKPSQSYKKVVKTLKEINLKIIDQIEIAPYKKDHAAIIVTK